MRGKRVLVCVVFASAVLLSVLGLEWATSSEWVTRAEAATSGDQTGTRLHDGAKSFGDGLLGGIKFVGRTVISPFTGTTSQVSRDADATGKRLHQGAKSFGDGLLGGLKYTGQKIGGFFSDSSGKSGR